MGREEYSTGMLVGLTGAIAVAMWFFIYDLAEARRSARRPCWAPRSSTGCETRPP